MSTAAELWPHCGRRSLRRSLRRSSHVHDTAASLSHIAVPAGLWRAAASATKALRGTVGSRGLATVAADGNDRPLSGDAGEQQFDAVLGL